MDTATIKSILYRKAGGIKAAAQAIDEPIFAVSQVINYSRPTIRVRAKLRTKFGIRFNNSLMRVDASKRKGANPTRQTKQQAKKKRGAK